MPNWCTNHVIVEGSAEEIKDILQKASSGKTEEGNQNVFSFENFIPTPEKELEGDGWYNWRITNWGIKWDLNQNFITVKGPFDSGETGNSVFELFYETAWSPALEFWAKFSEMYSSLKITQEFFEEGNGYIGQTYFDKYEKTIDEYMISEEMYRSAGAIFDDEGDIDWDNSEEFDMWKLFPLENQHE